MLPDETKAEVLRWALATLEETTKALKLYTDYEVQATEEYLAEEHADDEETAYSLQDHRLCVFLVNLLNFQHSIVAAVLRELGQADKLDKHFLLRGDLAGLEKPPENPPKAESTAKERHTWMLERKLRHLHLQSVACSQWLDDIDRLRRDLRLSPTGGYPLPFDEIPST